ncbi:hypothetical protein APSETT444_003515 [Aspergillus pseudonomiae]
MKHADGLSRLVRFRGCDSYQTEFDHTLLKASRGLIIMHSLFSKEKCFLTSSDWQSVMKQQFDSTLPTSFYAQVEELFALYTTIPCFIHQFFELREADPAHETTQLKATELLNEALDMQTKLTTWYDKFRHTAPLPTEVLSSMGDTLYPIVYSFTDVDTGTIFAAYYSYMVIIHAILGACRYPGEHAAMVVYYRDQICMSVEFNAQGILGPSRLGFPLLVVNEFADPPTKLKRRQDQQDAAVASSGQDGAISHGHPAKQSTSERKDENEQNRSKHFACIDGGTLSHHNQDYTEEHGESEEME